jgi:serine/threonine protein kinase
MSEPGPPPLTEAQADPSEGGGFSPEPFGKYYLVDKIAVGGMAEIFKAKTFGHGGFENLVVIKRILAHMSSNEQFVRMFLDEAKVSAVLQHSNIVRTWDFGRLRENYFLAMECVEGKDCKLILRKLAERRKLLPREFAVYIAMEAAKGLDFAHKKTTIAGHPLGIVHRDISPSNILVGYGGEVKVADFGIVQASVVDESGTAGTLKGKFEYMSPEQASGQELDRRSDIFSLGIVLHEMLTGRRLFKTDNEIKTLDKIKAVDIDPPSAQNPQVPARLDEIVMRALARDPADRYQDARELHADLLEFLYPASPDLAQQSLSHFMAELFSEEREAERLRLVGGTAAALKLHGEAQDVDLEPDWEESSSQDTQAPKQAAVPAPVAKAGIPIAVAAIGILGLLVASGAAFVLLRPAESPPPVAAVAEVAGTAIQLKIGPVPGKVWLDGRPAGEGREINLTALAVGTEHRIRVEADGYDPFEDRTTLAAGERLKLPITLVKRGSPPPPKSDKGPRVGETSRLPTGSQGTPSASTPSAGGTRAPVAAPSPPPESAPAPAAPAAPAMGKVSVNVSGGAWGDVYIDGKKVGQTPMKQALPAGEHTVRIVVPSTGQEATRKVTVQPGETASVSIAAQ